jgi:hypothetical protein
MSQAFERTLCDKIFSALKAGGLAESVTYRRSGGETLSTTAEIDVNAELFSGFESAALESRTTITLLRAEVGEPQRGDTIITGDGTNYTVHDIDEGGRDRALVRVTVA